MNVPIMLAVSLMMLSFSFGILFVYALVNIIGSKRSKKDHEELLKIQTEANEHRKQSVDVLYNIFRLHLDYIKDEKAKNPPIDVMK